MLPPSPHRRPVRRSVLRCALLALALLGAVAFGAPPAAAHAQLERTVPTAGASLRSAPTEVRLVFAEGVRIPSGGVRVLDESAERRDRGRPRSVDGDASQVRIPLDRLGPGAYVVSWRAVSADGHPIRGAFTFRVGGVGDQQRVAELGRSLLAGGAGSGAVGVLLGIARAVDLGGLAIVIGLALHALLSPAVARRRVVVLARVTRTVVIVAGVVTVLLYGPYASGSGLSGLTEGALLDDTLGDRVGHALVARTLLAALVATVVLWIVRDRGAGSATAADRRGSRLGLVASTLGLAVAQAFTGHGATGRSVLLSAIATVVHVLAAGAWVGGLAVLGAAVLRSGDGPTAPSDALAAVRRWSSTVAIAVGALVVTGLVQVWRQVGSLDAARNTTYGRLLLVKTAVVLALLAVGAGARRLLAGPSEESTDQTLGTLRRRVGIELLGAAAVVVLTSLLVDTAPARDALARPFAVTIRTEAVTIDATVEPARRGRNDVHLYLLDANGLPRAVRGVTVTAELPSASVEPIELRTLRAGPSHFQVVGADLPIVGTWRLAVSVRVDEFTEVRGVTSVTIR